MPWLRSGQLEIFHIFFKYSAFMLRLPMTNTIQLILLLVRLFKSLTPVIRSVSILTYLESVREFPWSFAYWKAWWDVSLFAWSRFDGVILRWLSIRERLLHFHVSFALETTGTSLFFNPFYCSILYFPCMIMKRWDSVFVWISILLCLTIRQKWCCWFCWTLGCF